MFRIMKITEINRCVFTSCNQNIGIFSMCIEYTLNGSTPKDFGLQKCRSTCKLHQSLDYGHQIWWNSARNEASSHLCAVRCMYTVVRCLYTSLRCLYIVLQCVYTVFRYLYTVFRCLYIVLQCVYTVVRYLYTLLRCLYTVFQCVYTVVRYLYTVF